MIPTPSQIFTSYERGEIGRDEMHAMMAMHARELIREMEDDYQNPASALIEYLLVRRAVKRLVRLSSERVLREILVALSEVPDFPPARYLWNASHPEVPLHCFQRIRREPIFRILSIKHKGQQVEVGVEYGSAGRGRANRKTVVLQRDQAFKLCWMG